MLSSDKLLPPGAMPAPRMIGLLAIDGFSLMSYASIVEPLRAANTLAGRALYRWTTVAVEGRSIKASDGTSLVADHVVGEAIDCTTLYVFAAGDPLAFRDARTFAWLRRLARGGTHMVGVSGGPLLLGRAGLLDGYRATIHWDHVAAFREACPQVAVQPGLYVIDRDRLTCAGGTAGLDLAIELIAREQGDALAARVGEWFIRTAPRGGGTAQRPDVRIRYGVRDDRIAAVLEMMERRIAEPATRAELASCAGVSTRQLERLFMASLQGTVGEVYLGIRLDKAAELLAKTGRPVTTVGLSCGFASSSHFSRAFRKRFGFPPRAARDGHPTP